MQLKNYSYICTIKINKMSLYTENKKALVEVLIALISNAQDLTPSVSEGSNDKREEPLLDEEVDVSKEVIPLGEPLTVTISNGENVSTTTLKLEEISGYVQGTVAGNMTEIDEEGLTVSDNLLVMFTELVRNEMLNI